MQILVIVLLAVIATAEVARIAISYWPRSRRAHFKGKLRGVEGMLWDLEFKVFKTREIREDIRKEYDFMLSRIESIDAQIKNFPADKPEEERKTLEDQKVLAERDRDRLLHQIKTLDVEVEGARPTAEEPNGHEGINMQIDQLRELADMLRSWLKTF